MYMAPEIVINSRRLKSASFESLKKVDVWAFGMVMFNLVNPNMKYPFQLDVAEDVSLIDQMPEILERKKCPRESPKYAGQQNSVWAPIMALKQKCIDFNPDSRPTASNLKAEFEEMITKTVPDNPGTSKVVERFV